MRTILAAAALLVGMAATAHADIMGSAPAFGGPTQNVLVCYYSNIGNSSVTFSSSSILAEPAIAVGEASEFCGGAIGAGQRCRTVSVTLLTDRAYWCRAVVSAKAGIRGRAEFRNSSGTILTSQEIR
jgi:hypothetical protein